MPLININLFTFMVLWFSTPPDVQLIYRFYCMLKVVKIKLWLRDFIKFLNHPKSWNKLYILQHLMQMINTTERQKKGIFAIFSFIPFSKRIILAFGLVGYWLNNNFWQKFDNSESLDYHWKGSRKKCEIFANHTEMHLFYKPSNR